MWDSTGVWDCCWACSARPSTDPQSSNHRPAEDSLSIITWTCGKNTWSWGHTWHVQWREKDLLPPTYSCQTSHLRCVSLPSWSWFPGSTLYARCVVSWQTTAAKFVLQKLVFASACGTWNISATWNFMDRNGSKKVKYCTSSADDRCQGNTCCR